jgi:hypothetical protein
MQRIVRVVARREYSRGCWVCVAQKSYRLTCLRANLPQLLRLQKLGIPSFRPGNSRRAHRGCGRSDPSSVADRVEAGRRRAGWVTACRPSQSACPPAERGPRRSSSRGTGVCQVETAAVLQWVSAIVSAVYAVILPYSPGALTFPQAMPMSTWPVFMCDRLLRVLPSLRMR